MVTKLFFQRFAHPWMAMALWLPLLAFMAYLTPPDHRITGGLAALLVVGGLFVWTLVEYFLHRFVFHWVDEGEKWRAYSLAASGLHMDHHRSTSQADLIVAPPAISLIFGGMLYLLFLAVSLSGEAAALMESGLIVGYLAYEWIHYADHRYLPKGRVGKFLRRYHLQHHHKNTNRQFGVTVPLWDWIFGTH